MGSRLHVPGNLPGPARHQAALGVAFPGLGHPGAWSHMPGLGPDTSLLPQVLPLDFSCPLLCLVGEVSSHHVCGWRETGGLQCLWLCVSPGCVVAPPWLSPGPSLRTQAAPGVQLEQSPGRPVGMVAWAMVLV